MRELFRRRHRAGAGPRLKRHGLAAAVAVAVAMPGFAAPADEAVPAIRITSPLGRTGLPGVIRIVARIDGIAENAFPVHFYVDRQLLSTDTDGPPYDALWTDDNPFEKRELVAEAELASGQTLRASIALEPLEVEETAQITSVAVEATVINQKGRFVTDLNAGDFLLTEDGEPQALDVTSQSREPALFALLVDSSQSMAIRANAVRGAAARLIEATAREDQIVVAPFSRRIISVTGPTTDRDTVLDAIRAIHHQGGTAIFDAVAEAAGSLARNTRRKAIVLITDGYDEQSASRLDEATAALKESGTTLYVIGLGGIAGISLEGEALLHRLAEQTGGQAWFPRDERQLRFAYESIASDTQYRYELSYTPLNQKRDGTWREIQLTVPGAEYRVRARTGYRAPIAPPVRAAIEFTAVGQGQTPPSLTHDDLAVVEDGVPQSIEAFNEAVQPVTFMLALDASGSMKKSAEQAQDAAREFIAAMRPEDELGMILFATKSNYVHSPTTRRDWSLAAIDGYVAEGGTALYDALYDSLAQLATVKGRRAVVVVTDGRDEDAPSTGPGSLRTWSEVLTKLQETEAVVYAVGIGSRVDHESLQQLADRSGGAAYFPVDVSALAADYHKILDELRRRYVVTYESTNRERDGGWRAVEIHAHQPDVLIRSRGGYYAPPQ